MRARYVRHRINHRKVVTETTAGEVIILDLERRDALRVVRRLLERSDA